MSYLATAFPATQKLRLPLTRDQLMLLFVAVNQLFLSLDTYLSHISNGTIVAREWIPIIFGAAAGVLMLVAGLIAVRNRTIANLLATLVMLASIAVGLLGAYFHVVRGALPSAPAGQRLTLDLLVWAPPILAPLAFAGVGLLGLSAAWVETPSDSGRLRLPGRRYLQLPYSKTQAYCLMVSMGTLVALISSVLDHARTAFENPWTWLPIAIGVFGAVVPAVVGSLDKPGRIDMLTYVIAMLLLIVVGMIGAGLHIDSDLTSRNMIVIERFLRGAPFLGPLLFSNMGMMGLIAILAPDES